MYKALELFTCKNEYNQQIPDQFGRSRFYNSANETIFDPVISKEIFKHGLIPSYPGGKDFALCISHDVDKLYELKGISGVTSGFLKNILSGKFSSGTNEIMNYFRLKHYKPFELNKIFTIHDKYDIKSTYFIQAFEKTETDYNYSLNSIKHILSEIRSRGDEIGLHGSMSAATDIKKLAAQKDKLENIIGNSVNGYRNHYLCFQPPLSWQLQHECGFTYDSTLAYPDVVGFRNGMCYPHYPLNYETKKFYDIVELPLVMMDSTIFTYMKLDIAVFISLMKSIINKVQKCKGVLSILWHNHYLDDYHIKYYLALLDLLKSYSPWIATSNEVVDWWKQHFIHDSQSILNDILTPSHKS